MNTAESCYWAWFVMVVVIGVAYEIRPNRELRTPFWMNFACALLWPVVLVGVAFSFGRTIFEDWETAE